MVAGGTGALGRAITLAFLNEAAEVIVTYQREEEYSALQKTAGGAGSLRGEKVDVTNEEDVQSFVSRMVRKSGRVDVLVNAVGGYAGGTSLWETHLKVFEQMLTLNLRAGFILLRAIVPEMLKQGRGTIVDIASQAAMNHAAGATAYAASKSAAVAMIDCLAADLKGTPVRANSVLPSIIDTEANRRAMPGADYAKWPKPEDIARVILFLCSDESALIHGASIPVYGNF